MNPIDELCPHGEGRGRETGNGSPPELNLGRSEFNPSRSPTARPFSGEDEESFADVMHEPHLYAYPAEAAPWWILALLAAALLIAGIDSVASRMVNSVLSIVWPV